MEEWLIYLKYIVLNIDGKKKKKSPSHSNVMLGIMKNFLLGQGYEVVLCEIMQDNTSTMALIKRGGPGSSGSRLLARGKEEEREIDIKHMPTAGMVANILTKPVQGAQFVTERFMLTNWLEKEK